MSKEPIRFEDLPESKTGRRPGKSVHKEIADQLRQRPGAWAHIRTLTTAGAATSLAHHIKSAAYLAYAPQGSFEAASRVVDGERRVYARYVGEGGALA